jgi:formate dehydrogenase assembly factor FdhD
MLTVPVRRFRGLTCLDEQDLLAVEEPLQIRAGEKDLAIAMRTPGNDGELATGFLLQRASSRAPKTFWTFDETATSPK